MAPHVFTIPASAPFLPTLLHAFVNGSLVGLPGREDPLGLAAATIYLPTRRACRLARDLFLKVLDQDAAILPRIVALGDIDEDELAFADAAIGDEAALELSPALGGLERRLLLARLVLQWAQSAQLHGVDGVPLVAASPAEALALADQLARLIDDMTVRQVPWDQLEQLVPERFDVYWQLSLRFLTIARTAWPAILSDRGAIEATARRDLLIAAESRRVARTPDAPVIAAGSTGSMPATAALLTTIAGLPHGAVVLPGLDTDLDDESWHLIGGVPPAIGHPQFAMQALLRQLGIDRRQVVSLARPAATGRERLISEALRPAAATERWKDRLDDAAIEAALDGLKVVEAANAEEEALAIALALRETVATPGRTAALVTPDRTLARRVVAALDRWSVPIDDSGGDLLADTAAGLFARLVADAALGGLAPVVLLGLLKHRLCRIGGPDGRRPEPVAVLEQAILRGPRPRPGTSGLRQALATFRAADFHPRDPRARLSRSGLDAAEQLIDDLARGLGPLEGLSAEPRPFGTLAALHRQAVAALSRDGTRADATAFEGDEGVALEGFFEEITATDEAEDLNVKPAEYPDLFRLALAGRVVRRPHRPDAPVRIFGLLEARLQSVDRVVLGGLVEGVWPPETKNDAWLSRPMRQDLGLDLPERRIGLSAHDFAQALGAREVILARAAKIGGAPTVASRFVQRMAAVAGERRWRQALEQGAPYLVLARELDRPQCPRRIAAPQPRPPVHARPLKMSVTDVEHWLRDPYTIYAKHVLRLAPLDAVDTAPGAKDRGSVLHEAIGAFVRAYPDQLPADPLGELLELGRSQFAYLEDYPEARAFWWPRFQRIARWFTGWDAERRASLVCSFAEIAGETELDFGERVFRLTARADRIDQLNDGGYAIIDYKTGEARTEKQIRAGLAPQLPLEAAILLRGGFAAIPAGGSVANLAYVLLKGGEPPGDEKKIEFDDTTVDQQAEIAFAKFCELVRRFEDEAQPYRSLVHPMWRTKYGIYDHLARVKEWSATGGATDPEAPE